MTPRSLAGELVRAALRAADGTAAVHAALQREGQELRVAGQRYDLGAARRVIVVGAGKAAAAMAVGVEELLGDRLDDGLVIAKAGLVGRRPGRIALAEAGHPLPDLAGVQATKRVLDLTAELCADDLVIVLLSGGGTSLLACPAEGVTLEDLDELGDLLLAAGAPIADLNVVRKHLSGITGGQLAARAAPARLLSLVLSDVVGDPLEVIASGPTVADPSTFADALAVLERHHLTGQVPAALLASLRAGVAGERPETPKPGDPRLARSNVQHVIIGSNALAARAAQRRAVELGLSATVLTTGLEGEARLVGRALAAQLRELALHDRPLRRPACLIAGGETTVTLQGGCQGVGGRNQELALSAALDLQGLRDVLLVALATDGNDGPTDGAGAMADGATVERARLAGLDPEARLDAHDAYPLFLALGDLLRTGPTETNVNDLAFLIAL